VTSRKPDGIAALTAVRTVSGSTIVPAIAPAIAPAIVPAGVAAHLMNPWNQ
jgi:hypothetical protein